MALSYRSTDEERVLSDINTTPLVDVMLVLLIIFLITIPVVTISIKVDLPQESNTVRETKPENIVVSVDGAGRIFWFDGLIDSAELGKRLSGVASRLPQPEVQIRGDGKADYQSVGKIVSAARLAGITKIGFITEPASK
ncbi:MAG: biopolymer transporter ExbD [Cytophagales bacterium]|nr:biopolymer transporter ExbD [Cytophagales bacterium]